MEQLFKSVQTQLKSSFDFIKEEFDSNFLEYLLYPDQIIEFPIVIKMDDGSLKTFVGYRSQHNNIRGPYKGGIRFHINVSKDEVMSLSTWMSLKTSVVNIPLGGGKGGIIVDPKSLSTKELERLSRGYIQKLYKHIGPNTDVPAPDVNTTPQIMGWMVDEYSKLVGQRTPGVITGKPLEIGGSQGRVEATALGGFISLTTYLDFHKDSIKNKKIIVQGAGNVGLNFAKIAYQAGAKIVGISDSRGGIYDANGLNIQSIIETKKSKKHLDSLTDIKQISNQDLLLQDCDILVPAALEGQIHKANADNIKAKVILELANGPITYNADVILHNKGIDVIPDILANAGGVTVSYFEQVQNNMNYYRSAEEVSEKLKDIMNPATQDVIQTANTYNTTLRNGAYIIGLKRILKAIELRK